MSQPIEDIIMKAIMELFMGDAVKFFGINKQIISATRTELTHIHVQKNIDDWILEADDGSFIHFEFQSDYDPNDIIRFMVSDAMLYFKMQKPIRTIVVYTADIKKAISELDAGAIKYSFDAFYMSALDGDATYKAIRAKIESSEPLTKQDLMSIVFLPMMSSKEEKVIRFERSISLSEKIVETDEKLQIQAMLHLLAEKFITEQETKQKLKEMIKMTTIIEMTRQEGIKEGTINIAKKMLKRGTPVEYVKEDTGLDESEIRELQAELQVAV